MTPFSQLISAAQTYNSASLVPRPPPQLSLGTGATIQHVAAQTSSMPKHSEDHSKKHEKLEYKFARLKVSVPLQLESASLNKVLQRNFFYPNKVFF